MSPILRRLIPSAALLALVLLGAGFPTSGTPGGSSVAHAAEHHLRATYVGARSVTFRLRGIRPRQVTSATLRAGATSRRISAAALRAQTRGGVLTLRRSALGRIARSRPVRLDVVTDTRRPTVSWRAPTAGRTVTGVLTAANGGCRVAARDDGRIRSVAFYVDGELLGRSATKPYGCRWDTGSADPGTHRLTAVAVDAVGHSARASVKVKVKAGAGDGGGDAAGSEPGALPGAQPQSPLTPAAGPSAVTPITGRTYYVSPGGSDSSSGSAPETAWRTVAKANAADLQPGDGVLFEGSQTFADSALSPRRSGTAAGRIVFGSYGAGRASLPKGIYLNSVRGLAFRDLSIAGTDQGLLASASGSGAQDITIERLSIADVGIAINSAGEQNTNWTIRDSEIQRTRDSGMILLGTDFEISGNTILDTGTDSSIAYGKHGIYLKVIDARVTHNTIRRSQANGVSVRYRNSVVEDNTISDVSIGIAWFQYDTTAGTSWWRRNTITGTTSGCIYVSPSDRGGATRESFVITDNTLFKGTGVHMNLKPTTGTYTVATNDLR